MINGRGKKKRQTSDTKICLHFFIVSLFFIKCFLWTITERKSQVLRENVSLVKHDNGPIQTMCFISGCELYCIKLSCVFIVNSYSVTGISIRKFWLQQVELGSYSLIFVSFYSMCIKSTATSRNDSRKQNTGGF